VNLSRKSELHSNYKDWVEDNYLKPRPKRAQKSYLYAPDSEVKRALKEMEIVPMRSRQRNRFTPNIEEDGLVQRSGSLKPLKVHEDMIKEMSEIDDRNILQRNCKSLDLESKFLILFRYRFPRKFKK
jgi:hypothetical protein